MRLPTGLPRSVAVAFLGMSMTGAVYAACSQIDAYAKVADYYQRYNEYRIQIGRWQGLYDETESSILGIANDWKGHLGASAYNWEQGFSQMYGDSNTVNYESSALRAVGALKGSGTDSALGKCLRAQLGESLGEQGLGCSASGSAQLAALAVKPVQGTAGVSPNTAITTEVSRALAYNEYPLLDVVRADLAWIRDNPAYLEPFRYGENSHNVSPQQQAQRVADLQRLAAIVASRAIGGADHDPQGGQILSAEYDAAVASRLARMGVIAESVSQYALVTPSADLLRHALGAINGAAVDDATEGQRYALRLQASTITARAKVLIEESRLRQERLDALLGLAGLQTGLAHLSENPE